MARDEEGGRNPDGQLVDRVVVTIAPMFLQGYNVLATEGNGCGARATSPGSGRPKGQKTRCCRPTLKGCSRRVRRSEHAWSTFAREVY